MAEAKPFNFWDMLADPNVGQALAGMGAQLDPEGAGGIIGNAASRLISSKAAQQASAKQLANAQAERDEMRQQHRELMNRLGPITPIDKPGLNGIKPAKNGTVDIDINPPDASKLVGDLNGFTPIDEPGINSITRSSNGSTLVNYTLPRRRFQQPTVADEVQELQAAPTADRSASRLSYTPTSQPEIVASVSDLIEPYAPRRGRL